MGRLSHEAQRASSSQATLPPFLVCLLEGLLPASPAAATSAVAHVVDLRTHCNFSYGRPCVERRKWRGSSREDSGLVSVHISFERLIEVIDVTTTPDELLVKVI